EIVEGALDVVEVATDIDGAVGRFLAQAGELRQAVERDVQLPGRTADLVVLGIAVDVGIDRIEIALVHQLEIRALRIGVADDRLAVVLLARLERHANRLAVLDDDLLDLGVDADLDPGSLRRGRDRLADRAHAAAREAPGADLAIDLAHV